LLGGGVAMFTGGMIAHFNYINNQDDPTVELTQIKFFDKRMKKGMLPLLYLTEFILSL
jgi:hypothetical protein